MDLCADSFILNSDAAAGVKAVHSTLVTHVASTPVSQNAEVYHIYIRKQSFSAWQPITKDYFPGADYELI